MKIKKEDQKLIDIMLEKSQEAFLLAIEIYNKPTIKYKVEGFTFFICNAWELMLKANLVKMGLPIYYRTKTDDKNKNRTISLTSALRQIMTNGKDPVRINLETIIGLRNMANHLIIPEYAIMFNDIFMACTLNYCNKLMQYFGLSINEKIPTTYITMFLPSSNTVSVIDKYNKEIIKKYDATQKYIDKILVEYINNDKIPEALAVTYQVAIKQVKKAEDADFMVTKAYKKESKLRIVHKPIDSRETHPYSTKELLQRVNREIEKVNLVIVPVSEQAKTTFTTYSFGLYAKHYKIKEIPEYAHMHQIGEQISYTYSLELIQKIVNDIIDDPTIFKKIKEGKK